MIRSGAAEAKSGGGSGGNARAEREHVGILFGSAEKRGNGETAEGTRDVDGARVPQFDVGREGERSVRSGI